MSCTCSRDCDFEIEARSLQVLQEIGRTGQALDDLLQSAEIVVDSSLCVSQTLADKELIMNILDSTTIDKLQFTIAICTSDGLHNLSFTLENHTHSLADEYFHLIEHLSGYGRAAEWTTFPSVVALSANTSDIKLTELHKFSMLRFLSLLFDKEVDREELKDLSQLTNLHHLMIHIPARNCDTAITTLVEIILKLRI